MAYKLFKETHPSFFFHFHVRKEKEKERQRERRHTGKGKLPKTLTSFLQIFISHKDSSQFIKRKFVLHTKGSPKS